MTRIFLCGRARERKWGGAWTFHIRLGQCFFEINFGRDRPQGREEAVKS